jgi:4-hydroxythreonine-4-phosphate dehydrogenase
LAITLGDVAGIGPEIVVKAWPRLCEIADPTVYGDAAWLQKYGGGSIPCISCSTVDLSSVVMGQISGIAGRGAYDFLVRAIDDARAGKVAGIITCPLHKEGLHQAGLDYPGHTEILAERCGVRDYAMALHGGGITVAHVTLHCSLRNALAGITTGAIHEKIRLLDRLLPGILGRPPRIAVAALNPHAGDGGLFGDEEARVVRPAVDRARQEGVNVVGPLPNDTLFVRAFRGEFDGVVALYHDAGHIAMKLKCGWDLVNITVGLPIVRASVAHGTAYDIVGQNIADPRSLIAACEVALRLRPTHSSGEPA